MTTAAVAAAAALLLARRGVEVALPNSVLFTVGGYSVAAAWTGPYPLEPPWIDADLEDGMFALTAYTGTAFVEFAVVRAGPPVIVGEEPIFETTPPKETAER